LLKKLINPLSIFQPESLLKHFDLLEVKELCKVSNKKMIYHIELTEKNELPKAYNRFDYESKGFYPLRLFKTSLYEEKLFIELLSDVDGEKSKAVQKSKVITHL
jgi:hypothetical protein